MGSQTGRSKLSKCCVCVCVCTFAHVYVHVSLTFYHVYLKDATATIIFVSRRTWHLFEGSYCSYMYIHVILSACEEHGEPRQLDEVFCFDSVGVGTMSRRWCGFHFGEILTATPEPKNSYERHAVCVNIDNIVLYYVPVVYIVCGVKEDEEIIGHVPHIECSLLYIGHFQSFALCLHTWCCRVTASLMIIMIAIKCYVYLKVATKRSASLFE